MVVPPSLRPESSRNAWVAAISWSALGTRPPTRLVRPRQTGSARSASLVGTLIRPSALLVETYGPELMGTRTLPAGSSWAARVAGEVSRLRRCSGVGVPPSATPSAVSPSFGSGAWATVLPRVTVLSWASAWPMLRTTFSVGSSWALR